MLSVSLETTEIPDLYLKETFSLKVESSCCNPGWPPNLLSVSVYSLNEQE